MRRTLLAVALTVAALAAMAGPALATVSPDGEPPFTNTGSDTFWFSYAGGADPHQVCFAIADGATPLAGSDCGAFNGGHASWTYPACTGANGPRCLAAGHTYAVTASDADGSAQESTTIDLAAPTATVSIDGGAIATNNPILAIHIGYEDALSPPFPATFGGTTFDCLNRSSPCSPPVSDTRFYDEGCSHAGSADSVVNTFDCAVDVSQPPASMPDGTVYYCAREADAAIPDDTASSGVPATYDATTAATANWSSAACASIALDRVAPSVAAMANGNASGTSVTAGAAVSFGATSLDALSGPDGGYHWDFGDGTTADGASVAHAYGSAGTFTARVTTHDRAGNPGGDAIAVAVGDAGGGGGGNGGTGGGGNGGIQAPGGRAHLVNASGGKTAPALSPAQIAKETGGGSTQVGIVKGGLAVRAPRVVRRGTAARRLPMTLLSGAKGRLTLRLSRAGRVVAQGSLTVSSTGVAGFRLRLPSRLALGRYALKLTWSPRSGAAASRTLKVTFSARRTA